MSLIAKWGLGAELVFDSGRAEVAMGTARRGVKLLRDSFTELRTGVSASLSSLGQVSLVLAPIGAAFGYVAQRASGMAADLEAQRLTMTTLLGDAAKADGLLRMIRENAAATPFQEGDLIEGSKRLLRLTGDNVGANMKLLELVETMAALNPTKSITDGVEAILDATSGGGFERLKEFGITLRADQFDVRAGEAGFEDLVTTAIRQVVEGQTGGRDLVGALSKTFTGRLSTLRDAVEFGLRGIGESINARIGPALEGITERVKLTADEVVVAFDDAATRVERLWARHLQPLIDQGVALWDGLGAGGRRQVLGLAAGIAILLTVLVPAVAALGGVAFVLSSIASAVAPLLALLAPEVVLPAAGAIAVLAGAAALLGAVVFTAFRDEGEGPLAFLQRLAGGGLELVRSFVGTAGPLLAAFGEGFGMVFGPNAIEALETLREPLQGLSERLSVLFGFVFGEGADGFHALTIAARSLGGAVAESVLKPFRFVIEVIRIVVATISLLVDAIAPLAAGLRVLGDLFVANVKEGVTFEGTIKAMVAALTTVVVAGVNALVQLVVGTVEQVLRLAAGAAVAFGLRGLGAELTHQADRAAGFRETISDQLTAGVAGTDLREEQLARTKRADDKAVQVTVEDKSTTEVTVQAPVRMEGHEVARAAAKTAVRAGERGTGPKLDAPSRARVLRGGLVVTSLDLAETL